LAYTTTTCHIAHQFRFDTSDNFFFNAVERGLTGRMSIGIAGLVSDGDNTHYRGFYNINGNWIETTVYSISGPSLYLNPSVNFPTEGNYRVAAYFENTAGGESYYCGNAGVQVYRAELPNDTSWLGVPLTAAYGINNNKYQSPTFTTASGNPIAGISYRMDTGSCSFRGGDMYSQMIPTGDVGLGWYDGCVTFTVYDGYILSRGRTYASAHYEMELVPGYSVPGCTPDTCYVRATISSSNIKVYTRSPGLGSAFPAAPSPLMIKRIPVFKYPVVTPRVPPRIMR
jgi:hypothetical protein